MGKKIQYAGGNARKNISSKSGNGSTAKKGKPAANHWLAFGTPQNLPTGAKEENGKRYGFRWPAAKAEIAKDKGFLNASCLRPLQSLYPVKPFPWQSKGAPPPPRTAVAQRFLEYPKEILL